MPNNLMLTDALRRNAIPLSHRLQIQNLNNSQARAAIADRESATMARDYLMQQNQDSADAMGRYASGDTSAINDLAGIDPDRYMRMREFVNKMDVQERELAKIKIREDAVKLRAALDNGLIPEGQRQQARARFMEAMTMDELLNMDQANMRIQQSKIAASAAFAEPSDVRKFRVFQSLNPDEQRMYMAVNKSMPMMNLGGTKVVLDPVDASIYREYGVTPDPEQMPEFKAEQTAAVKHEENRQKWLGGASKIQANIANMEARATMMQQFVDRAKSLLSGYTTKYGAYVNKWPGSTQRELRNVLDTIRANVGFAELSDMRAMSPTGGALGQVSEFENRLLQSVMGAIDQADSAESLTKSLDNIMAQRNGSLVRMKQAYQQDEQRYSAPYSAPVSQPHAPMQTPMQSEGYDPLGLLK